MEHVGTMDSTGEASYPAIKDDTKIIDGIEEDNIRRNKVRISSKTTTSMKDPKKISSDDTKISYSNLVDRIEKLESESKRKTKELDQRLQETERNLGISPLLSLTPWRFSNTGAVGPFGSAQNNDNQSTRTETFKLNADMYAILSAWEWNTKPFWASLFVVFLQIILLSVLIVDLIGGATDENSLNLPGNVEYTVRIAQAVAVPIAVFKQADLREGIWGIVAGMPHAFRGDIKFQSMKQMKWRFGYFLRCGQGFLSMFASFILLMQAETVFDLLLNFLGIEFISDLDNLSFRLAGLGYFGVTTRDCVNTIAKAEFLTDKEETDVVSVKCSPSWCKYYASILGVFLVFIAMASCFIFYATQQYYGDYLPSIVKVEFGDETLPYLGIFNGCYKAQRDGLSERFVFEQMGRSTLQGRLAYCSDLDDGSWVLLDGDDNDSCEKHYIVSSGSTKTFDVLDTVESQWYTNTGLPLEYLQIYRVDNEPASCGSIELLDATRESCLEVDLEVDGRSSTFQKHQLSVSGEVKVFDAIRSHPIYVGLDERVVIFTGRRWVVADLGKIGSWQNTTTLLEESGNEEFYEGLVNVKSEWILSISEPVDGVNDQGTPLGLQWYFPRDIGEESNTTSGFNFRTSDLTRPVGLACASCNSKTNPCLYEGVCSDETGKCDCKNGASGKLCRERPSGDGICNAYFNTPEFGYDSGDCCASTCGVSACDNSKIAFPYGLDVLSKGRNESRAVWFEPYLVAGVAPKAFGYAECKHPDQANFTIEIIPSGWPLLDPEAPLIPYLLGFDADFNWGASFFCTVDTIVLTCDGKPYMDISSILVATIGDIEECQVYRQTFQVPYGASCEIAYSNYMPLLGSELPLVVKLFHGSDGAPIYEDVSTIGGSITKFGWEIPASKCITEAFSSRTKSIFDKSTIEGAAVNRLSTSGRAIEWCESDNQGDRDMLSERFALEALLTVLDSKDNFEGESHHCRVSVVGEGFISNCNTDDRVNGLDIRSNFYATKGTLAELLEYLPLLPQLQRLVVGGSILKGPIPVNEMANLQNLAVLVLMDGELDGTIPTEIRTLQKLERIGITNNSLTGDIPSELFSLAKLTAIQFDNNDLTGPAMPSELYELPNLTTYTVSNNRLSGSILNDMQKLPLVWLQLNGNNITGPIPTVIGTLERLVIFSLESNLLTGTIPTEIGNLPVLTKLTLFNNRLTKKIPSELGSLRLLETIQLQDNDLTGTAIFSEMLSLKGLKTYRVSNNRLTGSIPNGVENLRELVQLNLDSNLLTGTIPTQFGYLQSLTELTLFSNRLSGSIPFELANVSGLELCDILDGNSNMAVGSVGVCN